MRYWAGVHICMTKMQVSSAAEGDGGTGGSGSSNGVTVRKTGLTPSSMSPPLQM